MTKVVNTGVSTDLFLLPIHSAPITTILHLIPHLLPFLAPSKRPSADGTGFGGEIRFFVHGPEILTGSPTNCLCLFVLGAGSLRDDLGVSDQVVVT